MFDLFQASIRVSTGGYRWVRDGKRASFFPTNYPSRLKSEAKDAALILVSDSVDDAVYDPFDCTLLYLDFAKIEPSPDAFLDFANRYGANLFGDHSIVWRSNFHDWKKLHADILAAVHLSEALQRRDESALREHVRWVGGGLEYPSPLRMNIMPPNIYGDPNGFESLGSFKRGDLTGPATALLLWCVESRAETTLKVSPPVSRFAEQRVFRLEVRELASVMWIQFAGVLAGHVDYRRCETCGSHFQVSPSVGRTDKVFCSPRCRVTGHRKRRAQADQMYKLGRPVAEIAKAVGSDVATVKKWLGIRK